MNDAKLGLVYFCVSVGRFPPGPFFSSEFRVGVRGGLLPPCVGPRWDPDTGGGLPAHLVPPPRYRPACGLSRLM